VRRERLDRPSVLILCFCWLRAALLLQHAHAIHAYLPTLSSGTLARPPAAASKARVPRWTRLHPESFPCLSPRSAALSSVSVPLVHCCANCRRGCPRRAQPFSSPLPARRGGGAAGAL
jgi:hypothetical protein